MFLRRLRAFGGPVVLCVLLNSVLGAQGNQTVPRSRDDYYRLVSERDGELTYEFHFPRPTLRTEAETGIQSITVPFFDHTSEPGAPRLPRITYLLELPPVLHSVVIMDDETELLPAANLETAADEAETGDGPADGTARASWRQADGWLPQNVSRLEYAGKLREIPVYQLTVYPYRYHPGKHLIEYHKRMVVRVTYSAGARVKIHEHSGAIDEVLGSSVINRTSAQRRRQLERRAVGRGLSPGGELIASPDGRFVRLVVNADGVYKLTYTSLRDQTGFDFDGINPRTFRLINRGLEVPIYVQGETDGEFAGTDYIEFFGERNLARFNPYIADIPSSTGHYLDPWSDDNVYFLTWGDRFGLRMIEENGGIVEPDRQRVTLLTSFTRKIHFEEDLVRLDIKNINLIQPAVIEDLWAYDDGIHYSKYVPGTVSTREYTFVLDRVYTAFSHTDSLTINLHGISTGNPHLVEVFINNTLVTPSRLTWSGKTKHQASVAFSSSILQSGSNTLRILTPVADRPSEDSIDAVALNWFEIRYKQSFTATDDYLEFGPEANPPFSLHEFTVRGFQDGNISLYKKGVSRIVNGNYRQDSFDGTWQLTFQDDIPIPGVQYLAVSESAKRVPQIVRLDTASTLRTGPHDARYVIITPRNFHETASRLADYRRTTGYTAEVVDVEDIYDEFGGGATSPYAIRDFLRFTFASPFWQGSTGSPLYVLLVGDATDKPRLQNTDLHVPVQHIQTEKFGPAASDYWFGLADDDDILPDFFIGRLPVRTSQELDDIIDKIITYEQNTVAGEWKNQIQFIGGQSETRGIGQPNLQIYLDMFRDQSNKIVNNQLSSRFSPERVFAFPAGDRFIGGANEVIQSFTEGRLITSYLGHGGGFIWGDIDAITGKPLLNNQQVNDIQPNGGKFPLVLSMTCFVGAFDAVDNVLGELLLKAQGKGAIGVLASSGTGWIKGDYELLFNTLEPLLQDGATVGQGIALGKLNYLVYKGQDDYEVTGGGGSLGQTFVPQSNVFQFNYLGDPGLRLKTPKGGTVDVSNRSPLRTESVTVSGTTDFLSGSGTYEVYQMKPVFAVQYGGNEPSFVTIHRGSFSVSGGSYAFTLNLPDIPDTSLSDGLTGIRVFAEASDASERISASTDFAVNATYIAQVQTVPAVLTSSDTVRFRAFLSDPDQIAEAIVYYTLTGSISDTDRVDTMFAEGGGYWRTRGIPPLAESDVIKFRVKTVDGLDDSTVSQTFRITVLAGIDLSLGSVPWDPRTDQIFIGGADEVRLFAAVENLGYLALSDVPARFYDGNPQSGGTLLGEVLLDIGGSVGGAGSIARDTVSIVSPLTSGVHDVYVWVDPDTLFNDIDRVNNLAYRTLTINAFNVTPGLGTTYTSIKNDTVAADSSFFVNIPSLAVSQNTTVRITKLTQFSVVNQPDLQFVQPLYQSAAASYRVDFSRLDEVIAAGKGLWVAFAYDTTVYPSSLGYRDSLAVYRWDSGNKRWHVVGRDIGGVPGLVAVEIRDPEDLGQLALVIGRDFTPPAIEPTIEGQFFSQGSIVPKNPKISAVLYDQNGVSLRRSHYAIKIDGAPLNSAQIILPDSLANSNTVTLTLDLPSDFEPGEHTVSFQGRDLCGNISGEIEMQFRVVTKFDIRVMGNFPNPFANTTTFVFRVEAFEQLDRMEINIYTVAGRRIRKISSEDVTGGPPLNAIGYHEVIWDATDDRGDGVANGIYFYKIKGTLNGKTVEKKGKIAYFR